jgi:predicted RNase H-like nuclease (RuvC/YqgF family)
VCRLLEGGKDMSQRDGFASGFLLGTIVGGVVGGVLGAVLASRRDAMDQETEINNGSLEANKVAVRRRQMRAVANEGLEMETARQSLEDKIAQLNATIDDVRNQLGNINGTSSQSLQRSLSQDS